MEKKRIAMISYHTCPLASQEGKETGGMNIYLLELSKEFARNGFIVDIFTRSQDVNHEKVVEVSPNLRVIHLPAGPEATIAKNKWPLYLDEFTLNYFKFVEKENLKYDILHCHYYLSGIIGLKIKEKYRMIPLVMSFHTLALMKDLVARSESERSDRFRIDAELEITKKADRVIVSSETDSQYMRYLYDCPTEKLAVIPPGVNTSRFHPMEKTSAKDKIGASRDEKIVLFVGRIEPLKGIDAIIYAMKIIVMRCPNLPIKLMIVGGDISQKKELWTRELKRLEELRTILKIPNIVEFVRQKTQEELPYYYNSAEVLVMPSHYESFGLAALEAIACGVPVIATNVSGVASLLDEEHASLIATVNNPLLLADQIENLLLDEKAHKKVSEDLINSSGDLSWSKTTEAMIEVFGELIVKN